MSHTRVKTHIYARVSRVFGSDTVQPCHLEYLRLRGLSPRTITKRASVLMYVQDCLGVPLQDATAEQLADWRAGLQTGAAATIDYVSHLRQFFKWCLLEQIVETDPTLRLIAPRRPRRLPRPIATDDLMTAVTAAPRRIRPWLVLAAWAGFRAQEIAYLRRENVLDRHARPRILISAEAAKGGRERIVPLGPVVLAELRPVLPRSGWVFPRLDGQPGPVQPWTVSHLCNGHLHDCGLADTLHSLRHWFGTETFDVSLDIRVVQEIMGHASPVYTAGYAAHNPVRARAAVSALPALQSGRVLAGE